MTLTPNGRTGTFDDVTSTFTGLIQPVVYYGSFDFHVRFEVSSFDALPGLTPNQESTGDMLNSARHDPRAADLIDFLVTQPLESLPGLYDLIAPEELAAIYEIARAQGALMASQIQERTDAIRAGSTGFASTGYQARDTYGFLQKTEGKAVLDPAPPAPAFAPAAGNRWGFFASGSGQFANVDNEDSNARGYDFASGVFTFGADYRLTSQWALGLAGSFAHTGADLANNGHLEVNAGKIALFSTMQANGFYLDLAGSAGLNSYDIRRGALGGAATGDTNGMEYNGLAAAGYDWTFRNVRLGPVGSVQYTYADFDAFTEAGSLAPLHFPDQEQDFVRTTLGARASASLALRGVSLRPELRVSWNHNFSERAYPIDSRLASGAGDAFTVWGPRTGRDSALVQFGATAAWNERFSTYLFYQGEFGRNNYSGNAVSGGVTLTF